MKPKYLTRKDHDPGEEYAPIVRAIRIEEGARARHDSRVQATLEAAKQYLGDWQEVLTYSALHDLSILIDLDLGGIGGRFGFHGHEVEPPHAYAHLSGSAERMTWARQLGSGVWNKRDSVAWMHAGQHALEILCEELETNTTFTASNYACFANRYLWPADMPWALAAVLRIAANTHDIEVGFSCERNRKRIHEVWARDTAQELVGEEYNNALNKYIADVRKVDRFADPDLLTQYFENEVKS